jgi:hypothetical protein
MVFTSIEGIPNDATSKVKENNGIFGLSDVEFFFAKAESVESGQNDEKCVENVTGGKVEQHFVD